MLRHKAREGETIEGRKGEDTFSIRLAHLRNHSAQVEIDAPGWAITFGVPGDGIDSLDSALTQPPRSG